MSQLILYKSKLDFSRILVPGLFTLLIIPSTIYLFKACFTDYTSHLAKDEQGLAFLMPVLGLGMGLYGLYLGTRRRQSLVVGNESITVGSQIMSYRDIESIDTLANRASGGPFSYNDFDELVVITLKSGTVLNVFIDNYNNGKQFRAICQRIKKNIAEQIYQLNNFTQPEHVNIHAISFSSLGGENFKVFKSRPMRFMGLLYPPLFWGLGLYAFAMFITGKRPSLAIASVFAFVFAGLGFYMLYVILEQQRRFLLSDNYLVIKSNVFFPTAVIPLKNIMEIDPKYFNSNRGMPRGDYLHIVTSDFNVHSFGMPASYKHLQPMIDEINTGINQRVN